MDHNQVTAGNLTSSKSKFVWEINNFSTIRVHIGTSVYSPKFYTASSDKALHWRIQFCPSGFKNDSSDYVSIFLQNLNQFGIVGLISISIMNDSYEDVFKTTSSPNFYSKSNVAIFNAEQSWGWPKFEKRTSIVDPKNRTLVNDTLIISCSVFSATSPMDGYDIDGDSSILSAYNQRLFETGSMSDVIFSVEDKEMHLHKNVVASLSSVFEAMFVNDMKESKDNLVVIKGVRYEIMKELFRYIYTRSVNRIDVVASELLIAADKYEVKNLKMMCEISLAGTLNDDNALQRLELAVMHQTTYLQSKVSEFIGGRLKTFIVKDEFKDLSHDCKDEIFKALASKQTVEYQ